MADSGGVDVRQSIEKLGEDLDASREVIESAIEHYIAVEHNYSLEGNSQHWMCCSLFVASKIPKSPLLEDINLALESNYVSLTKLLKSCDISPTDFFYKIKRWLEMTLVPDEYKNKIQLLESRYSVSTLLFRNYKTIFAKIFVVPSNDEITKAKTRKTKTLLCTTSNLFDFCWLLFVCAKGESSRCNDLVFTSHLLLACIDMVYYNAYMAARKDLINSNFEGLPPNWTTMKKPTVIPCIMDALCKINSTVVVDAKYVKEYQWKSLIVGFFNKDVLKGDDKTLTGILDLANFDSNNKTLSKNYMSQILNVVEFDERSFLENSIEGQAATNNTEEPFRPPAAFKIHSTPLTGRQYLKHRTEHLTPCSVAIQTEAKLQCFLLGRTNAPSPVLQEIYRNQEDSFEVVINCQRVSGEKFLAAYSAKNGSDVAANRLNLIEKMYYHLLEHIIKSEIEKKKERVDLQGLIKHEIFFQTLFACCAEIVLYVYGSNNTSFPWILDCLEIKPFNFYKIIELVVLAIKEKLSRDVIKHLNVIEEEVMQSLSWKQDSPLWGRIAVSGRSIPVWNDVCIPENNAPVFNQQSILSVLPTVRIIQAIDPPQSPVSSACDRFLSPINDSAIRPGQSLLNQSHNTTQEQDGANAARLQKRQSNQGSIGLFFRKFYSLASIRMQDLCSRLRLEDQELQQKIWTCFEHSIREKIHLMKNRHLDQILMCAIYVICKVLRIRNSNTENEYVTFTDIMSCYRKQPQATSSIYRNVVGTPDENGITKCIDLIEFYNNIYVTDMEQFVNRFNNNQSNEDSILSPVPSPRRINLNANGGIHVGAHRVSEHHNLYIRRLTESTPLPNDSSVRTYCFSRSPGEDLQEINSLISKEPVYVRKRSMQLTNEEEFQICKVLKLSKTDDDNFGNNSNSI